MEKPMKCLFNNKPNICEWFWETQLKNNNENLKLWKKNNNQTHIHLYENKVSVNGNNARVGAMILL